MADSIILLYILAFIPTSGPHKPALDASRKAFLIQTGAEAKYHQVRRAAEKRVPKQLGQAAIFYKIAQKQEMRVKRAGHVFTIRKNGVEAALRWEF